jgi:hypothetical protein
MRPSLSHFFGFLAAGTFVIGAQGCAAASHPESPKPLDLVLEEGSAYVPNSAVTLPREYWVVIRSPAGAAYMFPRPDGRPELTAACAQSDAFAADLRDYRLCAAASSSADLARVNALPMDLAMRVSTRLHQTLRFRREGDHVEPYAYNTDLVAVCERDAGARNGFLKARCDRELRARDSGDRTAEFLVWTEAELTELPARLNALYGIAE